MDQALQFFQSEHVLALIIACLLILTTILLVVKKWIGFSGALLFLIFSLAAGLLINNQNAFQHYFNAYSSTPHSGTDEVSQGAFRKQMLQAVEDLKTEVSEQKRKICRWNAPGAGDCGLHRCPKAKIAAVHRRNARTLQSGLCAQIFTNRPAPGLSKATGIKSQQLLLKRY